MGFMRKMGLSTSARCLIFKFVSGEILNTSNHTKSTLSPVEKIRFLSEIINHMPGLIAYWDNQLYCHYASKGYLEWFGKSPQSIIGTNLKGLLGESLYLQNERYILGALAGQAQQFERSLIKADGSTRHTLAHYIPDIVNGAVRGFFVRVSDITLLKLAELRAQETQIRLHAILESILDGIITIDESGLITSANPATQHLFGYTEDALIGMNIKKLMREVNVDDQMDHLSHFHFEGENSVLKTGLELEGITKDDRHFPVELRVSEVVALEKKEYVGVIQDITDQKRIEDQLTQLAMIDGLTGLANRRHLDEVLSQEYARHVRSGDELSLILIDVDFFKLFNDTYGHVAGDECLKQLANAIKRVLVRTTDLAARYGGEEFACVLPRTKQQGAIAIAEKIREEINRLAIPHSHSSVANYVTVSLGVVTAFCKADRAVLDIVQTADEQLYAAKSNGRNRYLAHRIE
ncbi:sensor domain-containing diguanylate cyclase [Undibacterium sp. TC9W]|uniref:sensor domain-containing diguanylate cyclase n=1 Tax=Undibacterium sp. TC9W TaxID=3413053 RepID=UPI003BF0B0EE